jgi:hypothetical protein
MRQFNPTKPATTVSRDVSNTLLRNLEAKASIKKVSDGKITPSFRGGPLPALRKKQVPGNSLFANSFEEPASSLPPLWKLLNELNEQKHNKRGAKGRG